MYKAVPFTFRLKIPADYKVPAHWHPAIEHVTVISGTFNMGMGDKLDTEQTKALTSGSVAIMQPKTNHFAWTHEESEVQVHSVPRRPLRPDGGRRAHANEARPLSAGHGCGRPSESTLERFEFEKSGVVYQDVKPSKCCLGLREKAFDVFWIGDACLDGNGVAEDARGDPPSNG